MTIRATLALVAALAGGATAAEAAMVCQAKTRFGDTLTLTVDGDKAQARITSAAGAVALDENFTDVKDVWDGHMTGLITAPGLAVKYENHYGCFRNVRITTNVRGGAIGYIDEVVARSCKGGTTNDELCARNGSPL